MAFFHRHSHWLHFRSYLTEWSTIQSLNINPINEPKNEILRLMMSFWVSLRDQSSQYFNEHLIAVNAFPFSFVLCFKAIS